MARTTSKTAEPAPIDLAPLIALATKAKATSAEIETALETAWQAVAEAKAAHDQADADYTRGLLDLDEAGLQRVLDVRSAATIRRDRAAALVEALEDRFSEVQGDEAEQRRVAAYAAARTKGATAEKLIAERYPEIGRQLRSLLREIAEAEAAIGAVNADLPKNAAPLASPEIAVRARPVLPRKIVSETEVDLWCYKSEGWPIPAEFQSRIKAGADGNGYGTHNGTTGYVRRRFLRREFLPQQQGDDPTRLASDVELPAMHERGPPLWRGPTGWGITPQDVLRRLDEAEASLAEDPGIVDGRKSEVEFVRIDDAAPAMAKAA